MILGVYEDIEMADGIGFRLLIKPAQNSLLRDIKYKIKFIHRFFWK